MNIFKISGIIFLAMCGLVVVLVAASTVHHRYRLQLEQKAYAPPGKLVEVNNHKLHVYGEGRGEVPLIFMSGHGTTSPTIDFKPLWMRLTGAYRIVVVEKAGYGWSDTSPGPRDIDTILEETRQALKLAGENGPYVLVPHSMSGLEAIYWAQTYPDEVKAIIGLDPLVPAIVEHSLELPPKSRLYMMYLISRIGLARFMPAEQVEETLPLMKSADLTDEEREQFLAVFYRSAYSRNMLSEIDYLQDNAGKVSANEVPAGTPMYFFLSDGKEVTRLEWGGLLANYVLQLETGKYKYLDGGHYVHHHEPEIIAEEIKLFLKQILGL